MDQDERRHRETLWFSAYTGQMALLWQQVTYVQLTAAAAFGGWYLTWTAGHWIISCAALLGGICIQFLLILIIRRHAQILQEFTSNLHKTNLIDQDDKLVGIYGMTSHALARCACAFFATAGILGIAATVADQWLERWLTGTLFILMAALIVGVGVWKRSFVQMMVIGLDHPERPLNPL